MAGGGGSSWCFLFWVLLGVVCEFNRLGRFVLIFRVIAGVVGVARERNRLGLLCGLERGGHRLKPIRKPGGLSSNRALS